MIGKNKEKEHSIILYASGISNLATLLKQIWQAIAFKCAPRSLGGGKKEKKRKIEELPKMC